MLVDDSEIAHRVGGGSLGNLRLSPVDRSLTPPGISLLLGGTPQEAATAMRKSLPNSKKWQALAGTVGSATVAAIRAAGFDVIGAPTDRFSNHVRLVHPDGITGFTDANLTTLAAAFTDTVGC
jgi:hypothetical protein